MGFAEISRRIRAIAQTGEVTEALRLVSSSRLDESIARYERFRPYMEAVAGIAERFAGHIAQGPWPAPRRKRPLLVVVGGERGLAGAYHANLAAAAGRALEEGSDAEIQVIGRKTRDYLRRKGFAVSKTLAGPTEGIHGTVRALADEILVAGAGTILVYTHFRTLAVQEALGQILLPLSGDDAGGRRGTLIEPGEAQVGTAVMRLYVEATIEGTLLSALASEHAMRTIAMTTASENARDMMDELVLEKHRIRQGQITRELTELMGGIDP